ncbi:hypothetical protein [Sulfurimonas sp.]|uniref:hypothetical protein n=1 Tax=Sulfurimonas sp. TaxID=2022749 RepID=UPI002B461D13|nr:hypothetical protein [Sulfurimonas sp.]
MGALQKPNNNPVQSSKKLQQLFDKSVESRNSKYDPLSRSLKNSSKSFKSVSSSSSLFNPFGVATTGLVVLSQLLTEKGLSAYKTLAEKNPNAFKKGTELYNYGMEFQAEQKKSLEATKKIVPSATTPKLIVTSPTPIDSGDTLLSVLKDSTLVNTSIARQLEANNGIVLNSGNELASALKQMSDNFTKQSQTNIAYSELQSQNFNNLTKEIRLVSLRVAEISSLMKTSQSINTAYNEVNLSNSDRLDTTLQNIASKIATVSTFLQNGIQVQKTQDELNLTSKKLAHITFETTEIQLDNLGDNIPRVTPQKMRALKDVAVAKKNSDENTFDLDENEYDDWFTMPDLASIFNYNYKSARTIEGVNS